MEESNSTNSKLLIKDLARKKICDGHLYLSGARRFYFMRPGILLDPEFIKKQAISNNKFELELVVSPEVKDKFKEMFHQLRLLQFEKDLRLKCAEILSYFQYSHIEGEHFLSFALACYEEFCQLPFQHQVELHETDMLLFRKALYSGAFAIVAGMANNFYHYLMLKDFYNITFSLDLGLIGEGYSYFVAEACNAENRHPGKGIVLLHEKNASDLEKKIFLNHPEKSYQMVKSLKFLTFPELAECILYQHELSSGDGFPRGIKKGQVSSSEAVIIFADSLVEISTDYDFEKKVIEFLKKFKNEKLEELPVHRVYTKLIQALRHVSRQKETAP
jgi:hypothetical protein